MKQIKDLLPQLPPEHQKILQKASAMADFLIESTKRLEKCPPHLMASMGQIERERFKELFKNG